MVTRDLSLLLVEDVDADAELLRGTLHKAAPTWHLHRVDSLQAALEHLAGHGVDVVLLDLSLPDSQGLAGVDVLTSRFPQQALLVLSGDDDVANSVQAVQRGAQDYLVKSKIGGATLLRSLLYAVERQRSRQARRFSQAVVRLFNEGAALPEVLQGFVDEARMLTGCAAVAVRLLTDDGALAYQASRGLPPEHAARECTLDVHRDGCFCVDVVTARHDLARHHCTRRGALALEDLATAVEQLPPAQRAQVRPACLEAGFHTLLLIPIRAGERITGLVQVADPAVRKLPPVWIEVLEDTVLQLGVAIERLRATAALARREQQLAHLNAVLNAIRKVGSLISRESGQQPLLDGICRALTETSGWQAAWIVSVDAAGKPVAWAESGLGPALAELQARFGSARPLHCRLLNDASDPVLYLPDNREACGDCPVAARFAGSRALAARLRAGSLDLGLLCVSVRAGFDVTDEERALFGELARDIADALHTRAVEREKAETQRRLLLEMRRSQQITDLAPAVIVSLDLEGRIEWVNRAGRELIELPEAQIVGRHAFEIFVVEREHARLAEDFVAGLGGDFERIRCYECTVRSASGRERVVAWHNALRFGAEGRVEGLLCAGEDITDRKRAQAALAQNDRMATVGMLAAGVAHEINNPLTYILYNLEEISARVPQLVQAVTTLRQRILYHDDQAAGADLLAGLGEALTMDALADLTASVDDACTGAERVRDIVRNLKVFSRVEDDRRGLVDVRVAIETAISMTFNEVKYRARLVRDLPALPQVLANDGRLAQVFVNLLINAAQAICEGDVQNQQIMVRGRHRSGVIEIEVQDTGRGIPAEVLPLIFEPFFTTKPAGVGSGLGLSICRSIVASYGGEISAESTLGQGTTLRVRLPVATGDSAQQEVPPSSPAPLAPRRGRVLAIDDDPLMRSLLSRLLGAQHEVVVAASGAEAMALLERDRAFDALLCDVMMPEVTGIDLYEYLRTQAPGLTERFVFMTGGIFTPATREYLQGHAKRMIEKPFDPDELLLVVRRLIEQGAPG